MQMTHNTPESSKNSENNHPVNIRVISKLIGSLCDKNDIVLSLDTDGRVLYMNEASAQSRFKVSGASMIGKPIWDVLGKESAEKRKAVFAGVMSTKKPMRFVDERSGRWFDSMTYPILGSNGEIQGIFIFGRDITAFKEAEKKLINLNAELEEKVAARTATLKSTNERLRKKTQDQQKIEELLRAKQQELGAKTKGLEELNTALKVLLQKRDDERKGFEETVLSNVRRLVDPYLDKLKKAGLNTKQLLYLDAIEAGIQEIISPFSRTMLAKMSTLTPNELQVAQHIKYGKNTKETAQLLNIAQGTVEVYRKNIRKKLGLTNNRVNLRTYLLSVDK